MVRKSTYSVQIPVNTDQRNSEYGRFFMQFYYLSKKLSQTRR